MFKKALAILLASLLLVSLLVSCGPSGNGDTTTTAPVSGDNASGYIITVNKSKTLTK